MSFFDKKPDSPSETQSITVAKTGGEIDSIVNQLLIHSYDKDAEVRVVYTDGLIEIGNKQPDLLLTGIASFLTKNPKIDEKHKIQLIDLTEKLISIKRDEINQSLANQLIEFLINQLLIDEITEICAPASSALVDLSVNHGEKVIDLLIDRFKPGDQPNYWLIQTLSQVARRIPHHFSHRLIDCLSRLIPCLGNVKKPAMRWVIASALGSFAEALTDQRASVAAESINQSISQSNGHSNDVPTNEPTIQSIDQSINQPISVERPFDVEFLSAFEILFNRWLIENPDPKLRNTIVESIGSISPCLNQSIFETRVPKIINQFLAFYKKDKTPNDWLPVTIGLSGVCKEASKTRALETSIIPLLNQIHPMICRPLDTSNPLAIRNMNEQLRLIEIMTKSDVDITVNFLVARFAIKERENRVGSLIIIKHLINACDAELIDRRPVLMSALLTVIAESNNDLIVKKAALQLMVAMANHGYFELEGGHQCVKFIVQQCALPVNEDSKDNSDANPLQIRNAANHILYVMATKVPSCRAVMWPSLLEYINDEAYIRASNVLLKCIEHLSNQCRENQSIDYLIDWEVHPEIPKPQTMLVRLFCLASDPFAVKHQREIGVNACKSLMGLGPLIAHSINQSTTTPAAEQSASQSISEYLDETVPALLEFLDNHANDGPSFNLHKWQDTLTKVWRECLSRGGDPKWLTECVDRLIDQFKMFKVNQTVNDPAVHRSIHRLLGASLSKLEIKSVVDRAFESQWHSINQSINHRSESERQGFAQSMGLASVTHLDTVLAKLNDKLSKSKEKKTGFFASFSKDDALGDEFLLATIVLSFGYIAAHSQPEQIIGRIEVSIVQPIIPLLSKAKTHTFRYSALIAIELIARSVNVKRLPSEKKNFKLSPRDDLLNAIINMMDQSINKRLTGDLRMFAMRAASALVQLSPVVSPELRARLVNCLINYQSINQSQLTDELKDRRREEQEELANKHAVEVIPRPDVTIDEIQLEANELMSVLIVVSANNQSINQSNRQSLSNDCVSTTLDLIKRLQPSLQSSKAIERQRASSACLACTKQLIALCLPDDEANQSTSQPIRPTETCIPELGSFLSMFIPRCFDSESDVRIASVDCFAGLMFIDQLLICPTVSTPNQSIKLLVEIKTRLTYIEENDPNNNRAAIANDLAAIVTDYLINQTITQSNNQSNKQSTNSANRQSTNQSVNENTELPRLIAGLFSVLSDSDRQSALGSAQVLNRLIDLNVQSFSSECRMIVQGSVNANQSINASSNQPIKKLIDCLIRTMATQHFEDVFSLVLEASIPLQQEWIDVMIAMVDQSNEQSINQSVNQTDENHSDENQLIKQPIKQSINQSKETLSYRVFTSICSLLNNTPIDASKPNRSLATATCYLKEICRFNNQSINQSVNQSVDQSTLFLTLLLRIAQCAEFDRVNQSDAVDALQSFFQSFDAQSISVDPSIYSQLRSPSSYDDGLCAIMYYYLTVCPASKSACLSFLTPFLSVSCFLGHRIACSSLLSQCVRVCDVVEEQERIVSRTCVSAMLPRVADPNVKVRKHGLRGLGNLEQNWQPGLDDLSTSILSCLLSSSEDQDGEIASEAVASLTKIVAVVHRATLAPMLLSICFRIRPSFERPDENVRSSSYDLFASLCRWGIEEMDEEGQIKTQQSAAERVAFLEQVHLNLPILLIHCVEDAPNVRQASHRAACQATRLLHLELNQCVVQVSVEQGNYQAVWDQLVEQLAPILTRHYPQQVRGYVDGCVTLLSSKWSNLRGAAALLASQIIANTDAQTRKSMTISAACAAMMKLLEEDKATVRIRAVKGLTLLREI